MVNTAELAIVGAGPYGLSIAAHLRARNIEHRIVGDPMQFWIGHMPTGMLLKSEGFASSLSEPSGEFTLRRFCREEGLRYADIGVPVSRENFIAYGAWCRRRTAKDEAPSRRARDRRGPRGLRGAWGVPSDRKSVV